MPSIICPVCLQVLYQPIKLPCKHSICKRCLKSVAELSSLCCPVCRYRLSTWMRKVKDMDKVVDKTLDHEISELLPDYYQKRTSGEHSSLCLEEEKVVECIEKCDNNRVQIASTGAIHKEYTEAVEKYVQARAEEEKENEEASLALARQLLAEDEVVENDTDLSSLSLYQPSHPSNNGLSTSNSSSDFHQDLSSEPHPNSPLRYPAFRFEESDHFPACSCQICKDARLARRIHAELNKTLQQSRSPFQLRSRNRRIGGMTKRNTRLRFSF